MNHHRLFPALLAAVAVVGCSPNGQETSPSVLAPAPRATDAAPTPPADPEPSVATDPIPPDKKPLSDVEVVQADVRKNANAVYQGDIDTVLAYTHPKIIGMMGGVTRAKTVLTGTLSQIQTMGMTLESLTFPAEPTFLKSDANHFVIVPTKSIVVAAGQRLESLNYQFGIRAVGTTNWTYIEGSRINQENVGTLFPDFPADYEFPPFYRRKL
jgi:hypothetical protein